MRSLVLCIQLLLLLLSLRVQTTLPTPRLDDGDGVPRLPIGALHEPFQCVYRKLSLDVTPCMQDAAQSRRPWRCRSSVNSLPSAATRQTLTAAAAC